MFSIDRDPLKAQPLVGPNRARVVPVDIQADVRHLPAQLLTQRRRRNGRQPAPSQSRTVRIVLCSPMKSRNIHLYAARKLGYGTASEGVSRFIKPILTVIATARQYGIDLMRCLPRRDAGATSGDCRLWRYCGIQPQLPLDSPPEQISRVVYVLPFWVRLLSFVMSASSPSANL